MNTQHCISECELGKNSVVKISSSSYLTRQPLQSCHNSTTWRQLGSDHSVANDHSTSLCDSSM